MKKLLFLFLLTFTTISYSQTTLANKLKITANITDNTASKVNVQDATGLINTIPKLDLIDVLEYASAINLPITGVSSKIYVTIDNKKLYRWNGTIYQELASTNILGKENIENKQNSLAIDGTGTKYPTVDAVNTKVSNIDNTSDANKPVSTATQTALNLKSPIASPTFTGVPAAPTATAGTNTTQIATTAFVTGAVTTATTPDATTLVKGKIQLAGDLAGTAAAPTVPALATKEPTITAGTTAQYWRGDKTFQTLNSTAVGLSNVDNTSDANKPVSTATQTALNLKSPIASPTFTGVPAAPTATAGTNTTQIATTAFVTGAVTTATTPDATTLVKGKIQLAGDLAGTAAAPTVPALATKEPTITAGTTAQYWRGDKTFQTLNSTAVGLSNVDNTRDANKPISTATQTGLNTKENVANKNTANGYAGLGSDGKLISSQLPSITISDTFVTASQAAMLALVAETGDVAVRTDLNKSFILKGTNPTVLADWQELLTPTSAVTTVFGRNGAVTAQTGDYTATMVGAPSGSGTSTGTNTGDQTTITGNAGTATVLQTARTINGVAFNGSTNITIADATKEPSFTKNTGFNKNFGNTVGTVAEGNDSRILNGQTAYAWGNHASAGYALTTGSNINQSSFRTALGLGSNAYSSTAYLPLTGGTLSGSVTASNGPLIGGTLTSGYIPKATGAISLGNSLIYDNGTNVGIGTNSPLSKVHIYTPYSDLGYPILGVQKGALFLSGNTTKYGIMSGVSGDGNGWLQVMRNDSATPYSLILNPVGGSVGIGTTSPSEKLEVTGTIKATSYTGSATLTDSPTAPTAPVGTNTTQIATTAFVQQAIRPYKVYTALLTQTGTSAPTATVLENTLGGTVVWTRDSAGIYYGTLSGAFSSNKTVCFISGTVLNVHFNCYQNSTSSVTATSTNTSGEGVDTAILGASIEIRVYN